MTNKEIKTILNEIITPEVRRRADQIEKAIINDKGKQIFNRKGAGSGKYIRATTINQAKREIEKQKEQSIQEPETPEQTPETMDENKVRQMVRDVLSKPLIKKVSENHEERSENDRYMFFSNLEQMRRQCDILLDLDRGMIERILDNGHDWAQDHITEAKSFLDQVFDFLMNETKKPSMDIETIDEKKLTTAEKNKKEDIVKAIAKEKGGKDKLTSKDYAIATGKAKELAERVLAKLKNK